MSRSEKQVCSFWGACTQPSEYNNNGRCSCLSCNGLNCSVCSYAEQIQQENISCFMRGEMSRCAKCREGLVKQR